jgi:L-asparaginase II
LGLADVVELAILERSGFDESRHLGAAVVVGPDGSVLRALGSPDALIYGRSSLKLFQAITVLRSGVDLHGAQLVLASASHAGTPRHVDVVRELLQRAGLDENALQCPLDWPLDSAARSAASAPARVTMNCSGKHSAFLLACTHNDWPTESYLDPSHPLQQRIRSTVEEFAGESVAHVGVDGCGAPLFALTVRGLAIAVSRMLVAASAPAGDPDAARLVAPPAGHPPAGDPDAARLDAPPAGLPLAGDPDAARLVSAILADPWALDGPGRANTVVIDELGLVAKGGAEGVLVIAAPDGTTVALKMLDGSARATSLVALHLLASVGAISEADAERVGALTTPKVMGGSAVVGRFRVVEAVRG